MVAATIPLRREFASGERRCDDPLIHVVDDFLAPDECAHIIAVAQPRMRRSQVSGEVGGRLSAGRTNALTWVKHETDETIRGAAARIAEFVGVPLAHAESLQVIHYRRGQEYRPHFDAYDLSTDKGRRYCERGGQRLVTALAYLSDVATGGETGFPRLDLEITPRRGRLLIFHNCYDESTVRDPRSYHQGKAPLRGDKWAFNLWFHEHAYQP